MNKQLFCLIFFSLLFLNPLLIFAQPKPLKYIEEGKFDDAYEYLSKKIAKDSTDITNNFVFARLYHIEQFKQYDYEKAYKYIKTTERLFNKLKDEKELKSLLEVPINNQFITDEINKINKKIFVKVQAANTIEACDDFLKRHTDTYDYVQKVNELKSKLVEKRKSKLEFQKAEKKNTLRTYQDFIRRFPKSEEFKTAKEKYEKMRKDMLDKYKPIYDKYDFSDGELRTCQSFLKKYPDFPVDEDFFKKDYEMAKLAYELGLTESIQLSPFDSAEVSKAGKNDELNKRLEREKAKTGDIQISLMWNNFNDLDLHCIEPSGNEIWYQSKKVASGGEMDIDMNFAYGGDIGDNAADKSLPPDVTRWVSSKPIENIYWPAGGAPAGHYKVSVVYLTNYKFLPKYKSSAVKGCEDPTIFTVRIKVGNKSLEFTDTVSYNPTDKNYFIYEFDYFSQKSLNCEVNSKTALKFDKYIKGAAPKELAYVALQKLIENDLKNKRWSDAVTAVENYKFYFKSDEAMMKKIEKTLELIRENSLNIQVENPGSAINTTGEEYSPVITADNKLLYFCGRDRADNLGREDIFTAELTKKPITITAKGDTLIDTVGTWNKASILKYINTKDGNEAPLSISVDGNTMLLFSGGDIYYSDKTANGWSEQKKFPSPVNTEYWEGDAMLTGDGKAIIFTSNRPGGFNKNVQQDLYHGDVTYASDIYISVKTDKGWGTPVNLGKNVNTLYCERSPFLHPDMRTLYFSSDGRYELGKLDVFKVTRLSDNDWTKWSEPVNLGKSINTTGSDWGYNITTYGIYAYFSAENTDKKNKEDIYKILLPENMRPNPVVTISGIVTDNHGTPLDASLVWEDLTQNKEVGSLKSNPADGNYFIILPVGKNYGYYAMKEGYYPVSKNVDVTNINKFTELKENIQMISLEEMKKMKMAVRINNIFFDYAKAILRPESNAELDRLKTVLEKIGKTDPNYKIEISGHTDDQGSDQINQPLSENRAKAVTEYLVLQGIDAKHIKSAGYGKKKPVAPNKTEAGRQLNRRVEFMFVD
ncbi:MAG: OmpA family protein [Bacteroidia bacterium]|nr:OmpA family protein [Bacteroidia bacterium]